MRREQDYRSQGRGTREEAHQYSHEEMVALTKTNIAIAKQRYEEAGERFNPLMYLGWELNHKMWSLLEAGNEFIPGSESMFYSELEIAWSTLVYKQCHALGNRYFDLPGSYELGKLFKHVVTDRWESGEPVNAPILLENPNQVALIDAFAEATGIPHQRGQDTFYLPEQFVAS